MADTPTSRPIEFETEPARYRHWTLSVDDDVARLTLDVDRFGGLDPSIELKGNSYDLSVDIELADAVQRLRFEHPEVCAVVIGSADERIFCSGANIHALARASHSHKVNFCKFTNETRLFIEEASAEAGQRYIAACNGATAGGGYELALACDEIVLKDDGFSAVSLPEVPLLGVLPGTGGLTRLVDKRRVRPDLIDRFATLAEGVRGKRALEWRLVDRLASRSQFDQVIDERIEAARARERDTLPRRGIVLDPLDPDVTEQALTYRYVDLLLDPGGRSASVTVAGPGPSESELFGTADWWPLRMARELDDALLRLRFNAPEIGLIILRTRGNQESAAAIGNQLATGDTDWFTRETRLHLGRVLRRLELTARSIFAAVDEGSCFAGPLFELLLASDRSYVLDMPSIEAWPGRLSGGSLPKWNGQGRLECRFLGEPGVADDILELSRKGPIDAMQLEELGLATECWDELDFDDGLRLAVEERASLSPDALTGMEASTRFVGPETMATRIFGRLSAWQNWVFRGANATGEMGALSVYGKPERPRFDFTRA